jgi:hypothetical protein
MLVKESQGFYVDLSRQRVTNKTMEVGCASADPSFSHTSPGTWLTLACVPALCSCS